MRNLSYPASSLETDAPRLIIAQSASSLAPPPIQEVNGHGPELIGNVPLVVFPIRRLFLDCLFSGRFSSDWNIVKLIFGHLHTHHSLLGTQLFTL